jgi:hypothetical protein
MGFAFIGIMWMNHHSLRVSVERISHQYAFGPMLYLICVLLAWVSVSASLLLNVALGGFFALPPRWATNVG